MVQKTRLVKLKSGVYEVHRFYEYDNHEHNWTFPFIRTRFLWLAKWKYRQLINEEKREIEKKEMKEVAEVIKVNL